MALRDITLMLTYIYKNWEEIVELPESLDELLQEILSIHILSKANGSLDKIINIDDKKLEKLKKPNS